MKHLPTKERRRDREEFVFLYRAEIKLAAEIEGFPGKLTQTFFVDKYARAEDKLGYNRTTISGDIWTSLWKTYNKMVNEKAIILQTDGRQRISAPKSQTPERGYPG